MANFNLADYETVEERLKRFWAENPHARIETINHTTPADRSVSTWVVEAKIWVPTWTLPKDANAWVMLENPTGWYLKATGWAFEIDGAGMANKTSALENAETSAIGRALANMNYSGNKRTSREEMQKVERGATPRPARNWTADIEKLKDRDSALQLYNEARTQGADKATLDLITAKGKSFA
jgi:hypothetical protein